MKNILEKYHYKKITQEREFNLLQTRHNSLSKMLTKSIASEIEEVGSETYIIVYNYDIIGFFTIKVSAFEDMDNFKIKSLKLVCIYIYKDYRSHGIASSVLKDIIVSIRRDRPQYKYLIVNSFIDTIPFFINKGFDFYKKSTILNFNKRNVILLYKKIF